MAVLIAGFTDKQELQQARGLVRRDYPGESITIGSLDDYDKDTVTAVITPAVMQSDDESSAWDEWDGEDKTDDDDDEVE